MQYDFKAIESRWQEQWATNKTFRVNNPGEQGFDASKPKYYVLDMFPYPSGVGLHVGHPLGYIATDIVARFRRMQGFNVLHPMGYDAFGLPAEQFAVEHGVHPRVTTENNIANMTRQLKMLGLSYDWDRCLSTTDVDYYKWTQWIFLQVYNSWYDPMQKKARPISELISGLENERILVDLSDEIVFAGVGDNLDAVAGTTVGHRRWHELDADEQRTVIDNYRLAYLAEIPVNWCPRLGTVLANEEVTAEGRSERGNYPVFKRPLKQWTLRITEYADRLVDELALVDWPEPIKMMQRNWIGKSTGARVDFDLDEATLARVEAFIQDKDEPISEVLTVFTTRPDTLFGATYMVVAPEHGLVDALTTPEQAAAVAEYKKQAARKTDVDRQTEAAQGAKTGVFTGAYAINPVNGHKIPVWTADYVMTGYGTGAIMAVPAHDQRDFDFAEQFGLQIIPVVMPDEKWIVEQAEKGEVTPLSDDDSVADLYLYQTAKFPVAFTGDGKAINSENPEISLNGLSVDEAKARITKWLAAKGQGRATTQYKLRDWLFSRQRYWGEPFPILHGPDGEVRALEAKDLPVQLPDMEDFKPTASDDPDAPPQPPLSRAPDSWKYVTIDGKKYTREFNTMPQWAGSCWYYLRFMDNKDSRSLVGADVEAYWATATGKQEQAPAGGIDLYVGGAEHAVLHLLYARFWHKVLFDLGHVSTAEPFGRLFNQGYIQAFAYTDERGVYVNASEVVERPGQAVTMTRNELVNGQWKPVEHQTTFFYKDQPVMQEFGKMGKGLKNAVAPDEVCEQYGCDTLRLYEMYMGPLDQSKVWRTQDIVGVHRFLQRVWRNFYHHETGAWRVADVPVPDAIDRVTHKTIKRVTDAMNGLSFNVTIAALIEMNNELVKLDAIPRKTAETFVLLLSPIAPHIAEELWSRLGHSKSLAYEPWPAFDPARLVESTVEYPVSINGKVRGHLKVASDADETTVKNAALEDEKVRAAIGGKEVKKVIFVKGKMVNIVIAG
jgi:leucyl-tRNA synthetase